jgi:hypothetical protein
MIKNVAIDQAGNQTNNLKKNDMPVSPEALSALSSSSNIVAPVVNSLAQASQNKKNRQFSEKMYEKQKADSYVAWTAQNEYNSPKAQMSRFQEAGLNPNLIYGQGNSGNSGAVSTPDVQTPQTRSPEWGNAFQGAAQGSLQYMNQIYDIKIKQATYDNLLSQNTVIENQADLVAAQTANTGASEGWTRFRTGFETDLAGTSGDLRREQLRQMTTNIDNSINENARKEIQLSTSVQEAAERILNMKQQRSNMGVDQLKSQMEIKRMQENIRQMQKDGILKDFEIGLRRQGLTWHDPMWARKVGTLLTNGTPYGKDHLLPGDVPIPDVMGGLKKFYQKIKDNWNNSSPSHFSPHWGDKF